MSNNQHIQIHNLKSSMITERKIAPLSCFVKKVGTLTIFLQNFHCIASIAHIYEPESSNSIKTARPQNTLQTAVEKYFDKMKLKSYHTLES